MKKELMTSLNDEQLAATINTEGATIIIAGAGVGKTRVLTHKIAYLTSYLKVPHERILALTFTNKAAKEMQERVTNLLDDHKLKFNIATYHSFCAKVLRHDIHHLGLTNNFNIIDTEDKRKIIKDIYTKTFNEKIEVSELRLVSSLISQWKNEEISKSDIIRENYEEKEWILRARVYEKYLENQIENQFIDFDDLLLLVKQLFQKFPDVLQKWQNKFSYVLVDEFQDTNDLQYAILKKIVETHQNLTVVGDPDQTIYTWRGANINLILKFTSYFPEAKTFILKQNYRSTHKILNLANSLIEKNQQRIKKDLYTLNNIGNNTIVFFAQSANQEANWIAKKIQSIISKGKENLSDIAILYRNNFLSKDIEQALINHNLNYRIIGGFKFYERKEIKDVLAYLKIIAWNDNLSMMRILATIPKIGAKTIDNYVLAAQKLNLTIAEYLQQHADNLSNTHKNAVIPLINQLQKLKLLAKSVTSLHNFCNLVLEQTNYLAQLKNNLETERIENINQLLAQMLEYDTNNEKIEGIELLSNFLQEVSLYTDVDKENKSAAINLMTIHSAKGLEFNVVFIIGLNEGILPGFNSSGDKNVTEKMKLEEERRLLYVAITRAKKDLFISSSNGFSYVLNRYTSPSRFLSEFDQTLIKIIKTNEFYDHKVITNHNQFQLYAKNKTFYNIGVTGTKNNIWNIGDHLQHQIFGKGIITKVIGDKIAVAFAKKQGAIKILNSNHTNIKKINENDSN